MDEIRVFIASPGDLAEERGEFRVTIDRLNMGFGDGANKKFIPLGWEDTLATTGRRTQSLINQEIDRCDVFILAFYRRWGQNASDSQFSSYTEEEFHRALARFQKTGAPAIFVFFKFVDPAHEADPGPQLEKVLTFRKHLEETCSTFYRSFRDPGSFRDEIDKHLRAYSKGELPSPESRTLDLVLPIEHIHAINRAARKARIATEQLETLQEEQDLLRARAEELALTLARQASNAIKNGETDLARELIVKASSGTTSMEVLSLAAEFFEQTGDLEAAGSMLNRALSVCGRHRPSKASADLLKRLGNLHMARSELDQAERLYLESLEMCRQIDDREGQARAIGNLGLVHQTRGDFGQAERMLAESLGVFRDLGEQDGTATALGNLGLIYRTVGDFDRAENAHVESLQIAESLEDHHGEAIQSGNLGLVYQDRGNLDDAETMHRKSLKINQQLNNQEGIADQNDYLGTLFQSRKDLQSAESYHRHALAIYQDIGRLEGIASALGNLGALHLSKGELDLAEEMLRKALEIDENLGRKEGVASAYGYLGSVYLGRGDWKRSASLFRKALALEIQLDRKAGIEAAQDNLRLATEKVQQEH